MNNRLGVVACVFAAGLSTSAFAADEPAAESRLPGSFTGNIAITSDYVFRGVSQTNNNVTVQGGVDWDTGAGFHFGVWGSNLNFQDNSEASAEADLYAGYAGKINDALSYDVGVVYYVYPGAARALNYDYWEVFGKAVYDFGPAAVNAGVYYSPDNTGGTGPATYVMSGLTVPLGGIFSVSGGLNYYFLDQGHAPPAFFPDYLDWNIGAKANVNNWFNVDVRYYDTDIAGGCAAANGKRWCGSKVVATLSRTF